MTELFTAIPSIDWRSQLPRASWNIGTRPATTSITVHYNGPSVPSNRQSGNGLLQQLIIDTQWQMTKGWGGSTDGADGLMYHLIVAADGVIYQTRDMSAMLWHCAAQDGNTNGLAVQLPLGDSQAPSDVQWQQTIKLLDALRSVYHIPASRVLGHLEWKHATACPGPILMPRVQQYRNTAASVTPTATTFDRYQVVSSDALNVRQGPGTEFPIAATLKPGSIIYIDVVKDNNWLHMAKVTNEQADLGFVSGYYLQKL